MTDSSLFAQRVEHELLSARVIANHTCEAFFELSPQCRMAYASAMQFLGCGAVEMPSGDAIPVHEVDRIRAVRLMLMSLYLDTGVPAWSSWRLDRLLEAVMQSPGGGIGDMLRALHELLDEYPGEFTEPMRNLIKDLVIQSFVQYRASYESADLRWMVQKIIQHPTPAQAYLALQAVPPKIMSPTCAVAILRKLAYTPYWKEAINTLSDDLNGEEAQEPLRKWLAEGVPHPCMEDIQHVLEGNQT